MKKPSLIQALAMDAVADLHDLKGKQRDRAAISYAIGWWKACRREEYDEAALDKLSWWISHVLATRGYAECLTVEKNYRKTCAECAE